MIKDIDKQIREWHDNDNHEAIIELLESLPSTTLTHERLGWLARAYNNLGSEEHPEHYETAIRVLNSIRDEIDEHDTLWNYRMGYSLFYLDREGEALNYLFAALDVNIEDEELRKDIHELVEQCMKYISLPSPTQGFFLDRVGRAWEKFSAEEAQLRQMIDNGLPGEMLTGQISELLAPAFPQLAFEIRKDEEKYHLVFSAEGQKAWLFPLLYFIHQAPVAIYRHWKFTIGRQANPEYMIDFGQSKISAKDVQVWIADTHNEDTVAVKLYSQQLVDAGGANPDEKSPLWWRAEVLTETAVGELPCMEYISSIDALTEPETTEADIKLSDLYAYLAHRYANRPEWENAEAITAQEITYHFTHDTPPDPEHLRMDIVSGKTRCAALVSDFARDESFTADNFHRYGITPGFLAFSLPHIPKGETKETTIDNLCNALENYINKHTHDNCVDFIGRAVGTNYIYVDFIAYHCRQVTETAFDFFKTTNIEFAAFQVFRRHAFFYDLIKDE